MKTLSFAGSNFIIRNIVAISDVKEKRDLDDKFKEIGKTYFVNVFSNGFSGTEHFDNKEDADKRLDDIFDILNGSDDV